MTDTASLLEIITFIVHVVGMLLLWHLIRLTLAQRKSVIILQHTVTITIFDARILAANRNLRCEYNRLFMHTSLIAIVVGMLFRPDINTVWATFIHIILTSIAIMSIGMSVLDVRSEHKMNKLMASI